MSDAASSANTAGETQAILPPGQRLAQARERLGLSCSDAARHLKLQPRQLEALERDNYAFFQGAVFARGFLRNYGRFLGLDSDELVASAEAAGLLPVVSNQAPPRPPVGVPVAEPARFRGGREMSRTRARGWIPVAGGLILLSAVLVYFGKDVAGPGHVQTATVSTEVMPAAQTGSGEPGAPAAGPPGAVPAPAASPGVAGGEGGIAKETGVSGVPQPEARAAGSSSSAEQVAVAASQPPAPAPRKKAEAARNVAPEAETVAGAQTGAVTEPRAVDVPSEPVSSVPVRFSFSREAWVEVRDGSGSVVFSQSSPPGTERLVRGRPPYQITIGNPDGVSVHYNEREVDLMPHKRGDVARITLE